MWHAYLSFAVLSLVSAAAAVEDLFVVPTAPGPSNNFLANIVWTLGSVQTIRWTTTQESYYIALFQQQIDPESGIQIETIHTVNRNGPGDQSFNWKVQTYDTNLTVSPVFFFWIDPGSSTGFTSHYFNITDAPVSTSRTSVSLTSSTTSSSAAASTALVSAAGVSSSSSIAFTVSSATLSTSNPASTATTFSNTSADAESAKDDSDSDSVIIKVGLGVGLGLGIPLVLIAGVWIGLKAVQQRKHSARHAESNMPLAQLYAEPKRDPGPPPPSHANEPVYQSHEVHEAPVRYPSPAELG